MSIWRMYERYRHPHLDGMQAFYLNGMLRALVHALVGIFTPVYLYTLGLKQWGDIRYAVILAAGYYLVTRVVVLLTAMPVSKVIERIGFRRSIAVSLFFMAISLVALLFAEKNLYYALISAISGGLQVSLYWIARNSAISQDATPKRIGSQMGILTTIENGATLLGPVAAGLMIERWGFDSIYLTALVFLLLSILPLWYMPHHVHKNGVSLAGFRMWLTNRRYFHIAVGMGGRAVDEYALAVIWPLAIFVLGISFGVLGGVFSAVAVMSLLVRLLAGKLFDSWHARRDWSDEIVFAISGVALSLLWIVRLFVTVIGGILALDISGGIFGTTYSSLYTNYSQLGGMRMGSIAYWVYGEMVYSLTVIAFMTAVAVAAWFGVWKEVGFILASVWVLTSVVMARESNLR